MRSKLPSSIAAMLVIAVSTQLLAHAGDWPRWRGPDLNGISHETNWTTDWPADGPKELWRAEVGIGFSSLSLADNRLFTLGNTNGTDTVWCFDAASGKLLWRHDYPCSLDAEYYEGGPGSTPSVDAGHVFTLSKRGDLFCLEATTGTVVWGKNIALEVGAGKPRWGFAGSPLVESDRLILNVGAAGTAVAKADGHVLWKSGTNFAGYATPVPLTLAGQRSALLFARDTLVAVRINDGSSQWSVPWKTRWNINATDPIVSNDRVFISSFDRGAGLLHLRGSEPPTIGWTNLSMANHINSCVLLDGHLYGIDGNTDAPPKDLRCVDLATGTVKWTYQGFGLGSLLAAGDKLIVLSDKGELVVAKASAQEFKPLAQAQVLGGKCWTVPVLANGRLYCRNARGTLVCVSLAPGG